MTTPMTQPEPNTVERQPAIRYGVTHPDDPSVWEFPLFDTWEEAVAECKRRGRGAMVRIDAAPAEGE